MFRERIVPSFTCGFDSIFIVDSRGVIWSSGLNDFGVLGPGSEGIEKVNKLQKIELNERRYQMCRANQASKIIFINESGVLQFIGDDRIGCIEGSSRKNFKCIDLVHFNDLNVKRVWHLWDVFVQCENGDIYCFGKNEFGSLGIGHTDCVKSSYLTKISIPGKKIKFVSCGLEHSVFLTTDGQVYSTGSNDVGQLCQGDDTNRKVPTLIDHFRSTQVEQVFSGEHHNLFLCCDGKCYSGGINTNGELGLGDLNTRNMPVLITSLTNAGITKVRCGRTHSVFISKNYECYLCGDNEFGECSSGRNVERVLVPTKLNTNMKIIEVFCGCDFSIFRTFDGELYGKGKNDSGQLALGHYEERVYELSKLDFDLFSHEKVRRERFEYVVENEKKFRTLKVTISSDSEAEIIKFILGAHRHSRRAVECKDVIHINKELFYAFVFAQEEHKITYSENLLNDLFDLYGLFVSLHMKQHEYLILKEIEKISDMKLLMKLFVRSYQTVEEVDVTKTRVDLEDIIEKERGEKVIVFKSLFNLQLFNIFKRRFHEIDGKEYEKVLEHFKLFTDLRKFTVTPIERNDRFVDEILPKSFYSCFYSNLRSLWESINRVNNYIVVSSDEKEIRCHQEVLLLESDYFFKVIKFGGIETRKDGYLILERLNYEQLMLFIEFIYTKSFNPSENQIMTCINLLSEIIPYEEIDFEEVLIKRIVTMSFEMIENGSFLEIFVSFAHHFHYDSVAFPLKYKELLKKKWASKLDENVVRDVIERSYNRKDLYRENVEFLKRFEDAFVKKYDVDGMLESVKVLKKENNEMNEEITTLKVKMEKMEKENSKLKENVGKENAELSERLQKLEEILHGDDRKRKRTKSEDDGEEKEKKKRKKRKYRKNKRSREVEFDDDDPKEDDDIQQKKKRQKK